MIFPACFASLMNHSHWTENMRTLSHPEERPRLLPSVICITENNYSSIHVWELFYPSQGQDGSRAYPGGEAPCAHTHMFTHTFTPRSSSSIYHREHAKRYTDNNLSSGSISSAFDGVDI